jgi:hypothetical protein
MTRRPQKSRSRSLPSRKTRKPAKAAKPVRRAKPAQRRKPAPRAASPLDEFIVSGASALGLTIDKAWMPAVRSHLEVTLRHGASVTAFALPDAAEPAPVFKA